MALNSLLFADIPLRIILAQIAYKEEWMKRCVHSEVEAIKPGN